MLAERKKIGVIVPPVLFFLSDWIQCNFKKSGNLYIYCSIK